MKYSMSDASGSAINENISNWLSVSVSPPLKMDSSTTLAPNSSSFYLSPYSCYGDSISFFSPLTVMPLKSDGSLCILEALSTTDSQEYGSSICGRETMAMNSLYPEARWLYPETISCQPNSMYQISPSPQYTSLDSHHNQHQRRQMSSTAVDDGGDVQSLRLAMSPGSQSSCVTGTNKSLKVETKKRGSSKVAQKQQPLHRKSLDTFGKRTSQFRGVTRHRWTGRYEAHLWDNSCKKEGQTRKGRQVYLGGYDMEEKAARAYDLAALKYWGSSTHINFPLENYYHELEDMKPMTRQEFVAHLRRKSSGFSRGASIYRGVTRHHQNGRWQARIGRVAGNKDLYLGTFSTQEEAAEAYDVAAIKFRGLNAVTNFNVSRYDVERIVSSTTLLAGELAKRSKTTPTSTTEGLLIPNHQLTQPANNDHQKTSCASPLEALNENVGNPNN